MARPSAARCWSSRYCSFSGSSTTSGWPAVTRSPRSAAMRRTRPSTSDETVTSSSAASVPTTSIDRRSSCASTLATAMASGAASAATAADVERSQAAANAAQEMMTDACTDHGPLINSSLQPERTSFASVQGRQPRRPRPRPRPAEPGPRPGRCTLLPVTGPKRARMTITPGCLMVLLAAAAVLAGSGQRPEAGGPGAAGASYANPIMAGDWSDPGLIRVGGDYYAVRSTFGWQPGLPIAHSRDLLHWEYIGHGFSSHPKLLPGDTRLGIWGVEMGWNPNTKQFLIYAPTRD